MLNGDVTHFQDNFNNRRVLGGNTDKTASIASMQHVAELLEKYHAQFWINHDAKEAAGIRHSPEFYESMEDALGRYLTSGYAATKPFSFGICTLGRLTASKV